MQFAHCDPPSAGLFLTFFTTFYNLGVVIHNLKGVILTTKKNKEVDMINTTTQFTHLTDDELVHEAEREYDPLITSDMQVELTKRLYVALRDQSQEVKDYKELVETKERQLGIESGRYEILSKNYDNLVELYETLKTEHVALGKKHYALVNELEGLLHKLETMT